MSYYHHTWVWPAIGWRPLTFDEWKHEGSVALLVASNVEVYTQEDLEIAEQIEAHRPTWEAKKMAIEWAMRKMEGA